MTFTPDEMQRRIKLLFSQNPVMPDSGTYTFIDAVKCVVGGLSDEELGQIFRWSPVVISVYSSVERAFSRFNVPTDEAINALVADIFEAHLDQSTKVEISSRQRDYIHKNPPDTRMLA